MTSWRLGPLLVVILVASACSSGSTTIERSAEELSQPPADAPVEAEAEPTATARAAESAPSPTPQAVDPELANVAGLIATAGPDGLRLLTPGGEPRLELFTGDLVRQPTWARDGSRLVATHVNGGTGTASVAVVDPAGTNVDAATLVPAERPYFFYSWSADGTRIAALGPGPVGTSLDILDANGTVISREPLDAGSLFLAWEPDGDDLLLNADSQLFLVGDSADLRGATSLGTAGTPFQAPSWLGEREALMISGDFGSSPVVSRLDVDTGEQDDLGPATVQTFIVVAPDSTRALLVHPTVESETLPASTQVATDIRFTLELLELDTASRTRVGDRPAFWAEWSPDGAAVLLGSATANSLVWDLWSDGTLTRLTEYLPSRDMLQNYIRFAPAFLESPRLWSPDSRAVSYGAVVDGVDTAVGLRVGEGGIPISLGPSSVAFWSPMEPD